MKTDIETMSAVAGGAGALLKGLKAKQKIKSLIINVIIGAFLGFGVISSVVYYFSDKEFSIGVVVFFAWIAGWLSNDITDKIEAYLDVIYDLVVEKTKNGFGWIGKLFKSKVKK